MILRGVVDRGQGLASGLVRHPVFLALGKLHPGSINVFVSAPAGSDLASGPHPFFRHWEDETMFPADILRRRRLPFRHCKVNGHAAFLMRTEHPGPRRGTPNIVPQPNTMFEIVGTGIPGINYGTAVELEFDPTQPVTTILIE